MYMIAGMCSANRENKSWASLYGKEILKDG